MTPKGQIPPLLLPVSYSLLGCFEGIPSPLPGSDTRKSHVSVSVHHIYTPLGHEQRLERTLAHLACALLSFTALVSADLRHLKGYCFDRRLCLHFPFPSAGTLAPSPPHKLLPHDNELMQNDQYLRATSPSDTLSLPVQAQLEPLLEE